MINRSALFTDETSEFKSPYQPEVGDVVTLKFRTLKNDVLKVLVCLDGHKKAMQKVGSDYSETFDFYEFQFVCPEKQVDYYFQISDEDDVVYYNRLGAVINHQPEFNFSFIPGFKVPDWAIGRVFYQIFPDRFCNGNPDNDVLDNEYFYTGGHSHRVTNWDKVPETLDVNNFYGGDLQGVMQKLDYLQDLGVEGVYFNPIFISPSNHKYDTQDYDYIDPHLAVIEDDYDHAMEDWEKHNGYAPRYIKRVTSQTNLEKSNEYFAKLVKEMHNRNIKVVLDGVFNHCGSFNKWMDKEGIYLGKPGYEQGAYQSVDSPYRKYFKFNRPRSASSSYEGWWGLVTLPKLNYEKSDELCEYIYNTGAKWVSAPYGADGWRLDVGADLGHSEKFNHKFWKSFRESVKKANPEAFIFAEHYGDPSAWFNGEEWDSVMNYDAFMEPVTWFLTGMEKHSQYFDSERLNNGKAFFESMFRNMARFPRPALDSAINQLSNHDHSRFLTRTNRIPGTLSGAGAAAASYGIDQRVMELAILVQMTWPGSPTLYYGDEAGQVGWTDPDSRRTYPWGHENRQLLEIYKSAIALRKKIHCLRTGSLKELDAGNGYIVYGRFDSVDTAVVIINNSDEEISLSVPVWEIGVTWTNRLALQYCVGYKGVKPEYIRDVKFGRMFITVPPKSGCVYGKTWENKKYSNGADDISSY
ncbi:MAG: glycoside hydrolase family 13 protein [Candidatus Coproplasma sp.]